MNMSYWLSIRGGLSQSAALFQLCFRVNFLTSFSASVCVRPAVTNSPYYATGSALTAVGRFLLLAWLSGNHCPKTFGIRSVVVTVTDSRWRHFYFHSTTLWGIKTNQNFFIITSTILDRFWQKLIHSVLDKLATKYDKIFQLHLSNVVWRVCCYLSILSVLFGDVVRALSASPSDLLACWRESGFIDIIVSLPPMSSLLALRQRLFVRTC